MIIYLFVWSRSSIYHYWAYHCFFFIGCCCRRRLLLFWFLLRWAERFWYQSDCIDWCCNKTDLLSTVLQFNTWSSSRRNPSLLVVGDEVGCMLAITACSRSIWREAFRFTFFCFFCLFGGGGAWLDDTYFFEAWDLLYLIKYWNVSVKFRYTIFFKRKKWWSRCGVK